MTVQAVPVCWDVRRFVCNVAADADNAEIQEVYRTINLYATLTWCITQEELYRVYSLRSILEYMLNETIQNAYDYGFFLCDEDRDSFRTAAENLVGFPEAALVNIEHLYCQDCGPPFPWKKFRREILSMSKAGLCLPFVSRRDLHRIPKIEEAIHEFLVIYGGYTVSQMYDTSRPSSFTAAEYAVLRTAKDLYIFGGKDNDRVCTNETCTRYPGRFCSMGETGCTLASDRQ